MVIVNLYCRLKTIVNQLDGLGNYHKPIGRFLEAMAKSTGKLLWKCLILWEHTINLLETVPLDHAFFITSNHKHIVNHTHRNGTGL